MVVTLRQQYNVGEKPTVILYTYIIIVFFTLTDRASTIPSYIRGCQSGTWSAGQEKIGGASTRLQREHENKTKQNTKQKRQKERDNNTKHMPEKDRASLV